MKQMELITTYICKKGDIGVHDNMFGGILVSLIDDASAAYAAQICDTPRVVTIKIDELIFKKPVKVRAKVAKERTVINKNFYLIVGSISLWLTSNQKNNQTKKQILPW